MVTVDNTKYTREKLERRAYVRQIMREGHELQEDVAEQLKQKYGIEVSLQTIKKDMNFLYGLDVDAGEKFDADIIDTLMAYQKDLGDLVKATSRPESPFYNPATAISAIGAAHKVAKDFGEILDRNIRRQQDYALKLSELARIENPTQEVFKFVDSPPVVDVSGVEKAAKIRVKEDIRHKITEKIRKYEQEKEKIYDGFQNKFSVKVLNTTVNDILSIVDDSTFEELSVENNAN